MNASRLPIPLFLALLLAACVPSLHPLYTEKDLVFDAALLGAWIEDDGDKWVFSPSVGKSYGLVIQEKDKPAAPFQAHLLRLGEQRYIDLYPEKPEGMTDFYLFHFRPLHSFLRVRLSGDSLEMAMLDGDWLKGKIDRKEIQIAHVRDDDENIVLTAPTAELQRLVTRAAGDSKAFTDPERFRRVK